MDPPRAPVYIRGCAAAASIASDAIRMAYEPPPIGVGADRT
jgi:hypothetical protein